jgi:hypothetical protein
MSLSDSLGDLIDAGGVSNYSQRQAKAPAGWEPGVAWDGNRGEVTTGPMAGPPADWAKILEVWNLDPTQVEIVEPVQA